MTKEIIEYYKQKLNLLRSNESEFENYCFNLDEETKRDVNQKNRYNIGVGIFNDLRIPEDYNLVQRLLDEEIKHRESNSSNYNLKVSSKSEPPQNSVQEVIVIQAKILASSIINDKYWSLKKLPNYFLHFQKK